MILNSPYISGSLTVTGNTVLSGSVTLAAGASLSGTASLATSASFAVQAQTASYVALAQSASNAVTAQTASYANALTVASTLTAQTLVVQTVTSSVVYSSGSNIFGNSSSNTQTFTGSINLTGSINIGTQTGTQSKLNIFTSGAITGDNDSLRLQATSYLNGARNSIVWGQDVGNTPLARFGLEWSVATNQMNFVWRDVYNNATGSTELMRLTGGGNLGIGTASPNIASFSGNCITLEAGGSTSTKSAGIELAWSGSTRSLWGGYSGGVYIGTWTNENFEIRTNATERMRISNTGDADIRIGGNYSFHAAASRGTVNINGTSTAILSFSTGASTVKGYVYHNGNYMELWNQDNSYLAFGTYTTEKMRITSGGNVLINSITATAAGISTTGTLQVFKEIYSGGSLAGLFFENRTGTATNTSNWYGWYNTGGTTYLYTAGTGNVGNFNMSTGNYTATSDINRKKDIELYTNSGLDAILGLKPTLYRMKNEDESVEKHLGFIAQEVKDYIPQAYVETIAEEKDGGVHIGLDYQAITVNLVKAIQELKAQNDSLQSQINELKA